MRIAPMLVLAMVTFGNVGPLAAAPKAPSEAKAFYEKATAAFALGQYAEAAENYEQAFKLKPDPALLYNAAQAHRLGGNEKRALDLYRSYLRVFPDGGAREEAAKHAEALSRKAEGEVQPRIAKSEPKEPGLNSAVHIQQPAQKEAVVVATRELTPPPEESNLALTSTSAASPPEGEESSMFSRPTFWVVTGLLVVTAAVGIGILASSSKDPSASLGTIGDSN